MRWLPDNINVIIDSQELPTATLVSLDLEYSEDSNELVWVGMFDGSSYYGYSSVSEFLLRYLRQVNWLIHDGIHAELPVLNRLFGGFRVEQIVADTKVLGYTFDSTLRDWGLKSLAKRYLGLEWSSYKELKKQYKFKSIGELDKDVLVQYNGMDCIATWRLWEFYRKNFNQNQWNFYNNIELPTTKLLYEMESKGILIDTKEVRRLHNEASKKRRQAKKRLFELAGHSFNPNSPKQVLPLLREGGAAVTKTDEDTIKKYRHIPLVSELLTYRGLNKVCTTYTIPLYTNAIGSSDGRIHTRFGQNTQTGRLSSSDPINLQNQPPAIKSAFVAKEGHSFVEADWSNLEWRIPGHFSGDPAIIEELSKRDGDIHRQTARLMFGQSVSDEQRRIAKTCNFLLTNSGRAKRLAQELGCSYKDADDIFKRFWAGYSVLGQWTKETKEQAKRDGYVRTMFGRTVSLPGLRSWCGRSNCPVVAKDYFCKECFKREETEREAVSVRVQGSGADLIKLAMLRLYKEYRYIPVLSVHDSGLWEIEDDKIEEAKERIKYVFENLVDLKGPLFCTIGVGKNWGDC